jgi:hypothetical protein
MTATESPFFETINDFCNKICQFRTHATQQTSFLLDYLVGAEEDRCWDREAE